MQAELQTALFHAFDTLMWDANKGSSVQIKYHPYK